ncbi:alpha/beta fold hydrolase [Streptomyces sp. NPDC056937]|uniref:alpha/beta fold hydrolase n=1 Tax=Streptomyces sp. NPDC056937 TaxID=3345969 RepID=UPI003634A1DF
MSTEGGAGPFNGTGKRFHGTFDAMAHTTGTARSDDGVRLTYVDHGGDRGRDHAGDAGVGAGPGGGDAGAGARRPVLLLHGLAGHAAEWDPLVRLLRPAHRVVAYDARGHGASELRPADVSRAAHVRDVVAVAGHLALERPVLVGQSLGGHTAMLAAAAHPDVFSALVLIEAGPEGPSPELPARIGGWLDSWPVPFASMEAATAFFGGGTAGRAWAAGLAEHPDGLRPRVEREVMVACVADNARRSFWDEWSRVRCPTLVVRGEAGSMPEAEAAAMRARRPGTELRVIPSAAHDVHLDQPEAVHEAIEAFLSRYDHLP